MASEEPFTIFDGSSFQVLERPGGPDGALVMEFRLIDRGAAPPPHVHPHAVEIFEVTEGEFELLVGSQWQTVSAGESVRVEPGVRHTFRNHSGDVVVVRNTHDPHHDFEAYLRSIATLSHELEATTPRSPGAAARMAMLWDRHDDLIQPADLPLKLAFGVLRTGGRLFRLDVPG